MNKEEKEVVINNLKEKVEMYKHFYLTDVSSLNASDTLSLRRKCFEKQIHMVVVKNTLFKLAMERSEKKLDDIFISLKGNTSVLFSDSGNIPAKLIRDFRKTLKKPILKAAFVEESVYIGDDKLEMLSNLKSRDELLGDVLTLITSPAQNLLSALKSGSNKVVGVIKALSEKEQ